MHERHEMAIGMPCPVCHPYMRLVKTPKSDWVICKTCTHTIQVHTKDGEVGKCDGYSCDCEQFVK